MKLKCPSCAKLLQIPDSAAGKVVKCPCGKQLRVPASQPVAVQGPAPSQGPAPRSAPRPAQPARRPAAQPAAAAPPSQGGFAAMGLDADMFDELTQSDLDPVAVAPMPGTMPAAPAKAGQNPYAPPASSSQPVKVRHSGPAATLVSRFVNLMIDSMVQTFLFFSIMLLGVVIVSASTIGSDEETKLRWFMIAYGISCCIFPMYYVLMEGIFGVTIGKLITGTKVVSDDGSKAGFGKILGRTLARFLPFEALSFFFGDRLTGWHDTLSGTRVISVR